MSHDYELVYRVHRVPGQSPEWEAGLNATRRRWSHAIWFPARRREKAFSDLAVRLADLAASGPAHRLRSAPSYRVVQGLAEAVMRDRLGSSGAPVRWQFAILRHGGYDVDEEPQLVFVSDIHGAPTGQPSAARVLKR